MKTLLLTAALASASLSPALARQTTSHAAIAPGMVSAADPRAVAAGVEILKAGGSATDAAIATQLALNVVEPQSSGVFGGSFWVRYSPKGGVTTIDARETAPKAANGHWFYTDAGTPLSHADAVPGGRSVGVPGAVSGMALAYKNGGRLPWARLFQPAIRLARGGWTASDRFVFEIQHYGAHMTPETRALYSGPNGAPLATGDRLTNPAQAALLERLAKGGAAALYQGAEAAKIVATVNGATRNPSKMTAADIAGYAAQPRQPVCAPYRGYKVCSMGPASSGGLTVLMILKLLERFDMTALGKDNPTSWHLFAEASRLAYADRDMYIGDPAFVQVPIKGMLDPAYLAQRSALISPDKALPTVTAGTPAGAPPRQHATPGEVPGTTDLAVADAQGNIVEVTTTVEGVFGSGLSVDGTILNNQLTDFDIVPDKDGYLVANRVQGGKRPRSSMSPTIVFGPDGKVRLAVGAAGGPTIIGQVAKAIIGVVDWHLSAQDAIGLGLIFAPGPFEIAEQGTQLDAMVPTLKAMGDNIRLMPLGLKANAIERIDGKWVGAADPRSEGVASDTAGHVTEITRRTNAMPPE